MRDLIEFLFFSEREVKQLLLNEVQGPIKQEAVAPSTPQFTINSNSPTPQPKNFHPITPYHADHVPAEYDQYSDSNQYIPQHSVSCNTPDYNNDHYYYDYFTDPNALRPTFSASSNSCSSSETDHPGQPHPAAIINDTVGAGGVVGAIHQATHYHNNAGHHFTTTANCYPHEPEPHPGPIHDYPSVIVEAPANYQIHDEFVH